MMARRPRAPVPRSMALSAMAAMAPSVNSSSTPSSSKSFWYCLTSALRGSVRIWTSASWSSLFTLAISGRRPMNSGIRPNLVRSSGRTCWSRSSASRSAWPRTSAVKPRVFLPTRCSTMCSSPAKAPPTTNRMFVVSIWMNSWWGCLRPPCGGTEAVVPSMIFSSACCTPSPETSRVIEGFSALRATLSISSM